MSISRTIVNFRTFRQSFRRVRTLAVLVLPLSVALAQDSHLSSEGAHVLALDNSWNLALEAKDIKALDLLLADTLKSVDIDGSMQSKTEFLASIKAPDYSPPAQAVTEQSSVEVYGDSAVVVGIFRTTGVDKGKKYVRRERFVDTWAKINGRWKCVATITVLIPAKQSSTRRPTRRGRLMEGIVLRQFRKGDGVAVQAVAKEAWRHTYKEIFPPDFIDQFVATNYSPESLESCLALVEAGSMFFCLAVAPEGVVGFSNIWDRGQGMELLRIYLLPAYIGKGVGRKLLVAGEEFVRAHGSSRYFCMVHKRNLLGLNFYLRNQFRHVEGKDHDDEMHLEKQLA